MIPVFLGGPEYFTEQDKIYMFTSTTAALVGYLQFGITIMTDSFMHCVQSNWSCATFAESRLFNFR